MYRTFGMILEMSLVHIRYGGIKEYFIPTKKIYPSCANPIDIIGVNSDDWLSDKLTYVRLFQIRAALHPEIGQSEIDD